MQGQAYTHAPGVCCHSDLRLQTLRKEGAPNERGDTTHSEQIGGKTHYTGTLPHVRVTLLIRTENRVKRTD